MKELRKECIDVKGGQLPVRLLSESVEDGEMYSVEIDGVGWFVSANPMHAAVLFHMMVDHITEYMHYKMF